MIRPTSKFLSFFLLAWLVLYSNTANAQDYPYEVEQFDFVQYDKNELQFPGSHDRFQGLYNRIDTLLFRGKGQINVVHVGGSHIQADMWSDRLRQRLQTFFPGNRGSRGLIFPYRMAKTNNPANYQAEFTGTWSGCRCVQRDRGCTFGLTGINVTTRDEVTTIRIYFRGENSDEYAFDRVRVFYDQGPTSYDVRIADSIPYTKEQDLEGGFDRFQIGEFMTELKLEIRKTDTLQNHFTLYGIALESEDPGFIYHAIGVNGAATVSYKRCQLWEQHLRSIKPDLVIFSIGINDANGPNFDPNYYERNYDELVRRVYAANPDAAILFTTNNDSYYKRRYPNKNAEKVRKAMMNLAKRHGAAVWDMYGVMGGLGSIKTWVEAGLANPDKIHLLKPGYVLVGDLMFNALMQDYDTHLKEAARRDLKND